MKLYRAAREVDPHFGRGSFWTGTPDFAEFFREWLDHNFGPGHVIYVAEVELSDHLEIPFAAGFVDSSRVDAAVFAAFGYRWMSFHEPPSHGGETRRQFVYLGDEPIVAIRLSDD